MSMSWDSDWSLQSCFYRTHRCDVFLFQFCPSSQGVCPLCAHVFPVPWTVKHRWGTNPVLRITWIPLGVRVFRNSLNLSGILQFSRFGLPLYDAGMVTLGSSLGHRGRGSWDLVSMVVYGGGVADWSWLELIIFFLCDGLVPYKIVSWVRECHWMKLRQDNTKH